MIRGSAVNNDGAGKVGYLAPSVDGQAAVVAEALAVAGVEADTLGYIEAHGSGHADGRTRSRSRRWRRPSAGVRRGRQRSARLGSVKANIGHLDTAAGVADSIKTALALCSTARSRPRLNFETPNPAIPFADDARSTWSSGCRPWPRGARRGARA